MLDRLSGKILHIDFGDCFEVRADIFSVNSTHCEFKSIREWTPLWLLTGCHDQREVPWKDPVQTDKDADQCHGGILLGMANVSKAETFFNLFSMTVFSIRYSELWVWGLWSFIFKYKDNNLVCRSYKFVYICEPPLWLAARWQAWMETTASPATQWWRCWGSTGTASWPCWRPSSTIRCSTGGWWTVRELHTNQELSWRLLLWCSALAKNCQNVSLFWFRLYFK